MAVSRPEQVKGYFRANKPRPICDSCVKVMVGQARPHQAQQIAASLATVPAFKRERAVCSVCGKEKLVTRAI